MGGTKWPSNVNTSDKEVKKMKKSFKDCILAKYIFEVK